MSSYKGFWTVLVFCAALPVLGLWAATDPATGLPRIRFDERSHDFGELRSDEKVEHIWMFQNDGDAPLSIVGTKTSCGCTLSVVDNEVIPPGESGTLRVTFDPAGLEGEVERTLAVISDDPVNGIVRLTVKARVTPVALPAGPGGHPPIAGQSLLMGSCASCHATPAAGKTGEQLYQAVCAMCHGPQATGGRAPSLRGPSYLGAITDEELTIGIAYGTANPRMPGFSDLMGGPLTEEQIRSLVQLLREWGPTDATGGAGSAAGGS